MRSEKPTPASSRPSKRKYPVGAEYSGPEAGVDFRVWAPKRKRVDVVFEDGLRSVSLERDELGYFRGRSLDAGPSVRYGFRLDGGERIYPDPASRFQPEGPHGFSEVVDPLAYRWADSAWKGVPAERRVLYEMHIGTFTTEGTWLAAAAQLRELASLGVTVLEVMPIAEYPGRFGWGYDGVSLFAPTRNYGTPDDVRRFVDAAHALQIGVILDVVYNHFGPDGNYLSEFSDTYFASRHKTDWGAAINYDSEGCEGARDLVVANAAYWIDEFHFDGLRLDATQNIYDDSSDPILRKVGRAVREAAGNRVTLITAENEPQEPKLVRRADEGGYELDALCNDDFHHTARVALTGHAEAYYEDYAGTPQEIISAIKWGFIYQGQYYAWQKQRRGKASLDLVSKQFITFLENHDQVANTARGDRLHQKANPGRHRALVAVMLLGPQTPLLFQGEEFASSSPFLFFADHGPDLVPLVRQGRVEFMKQFPSVTDEVADRLAAPEDMKTFERCKLDFAERITHAETYALYRDLLRLRHTDGVFGAPLTGGAVDGAVLSSHSFVLRFFGAKSGDDRLLLVNMGADLALARVPEPLLAPPEDTVWEMSWSSESAAYGGDGTAPIERSGVWHLPGEAAVAMRPKEVVR